ncbi:MAG: AMP-binding protein, partial [Sphingomonadaceae bacterium]|nr:AMP-binding protein [Sphingomonadaceae bacterium]
MTSAHSMPLDSRVQELVGHYSRAEGLCLAELLCDNHDPAETAFRLMRGTESYDLSYGELTDLSRRVAAAMAAHGLGPGARVATLMGKSRELLATLVAIWRIGAVHVPLFTAFASEGIALRLAGSAADAVFCDAAQRSKLNAATLGATGKETVLVTLGDSLANDPAIAWDNFCNTDAEVPARHVSGPDDPMICIFTSGTTGNPKGVEMPVKGLASIHAYAEFGLGITPDDVFWCAADPGWAYGLYYAVVTPLLLGQRALFLEGGFDADTTYAILKE